jgi:hypothetical protein
MSFIDDAKNFLAKITKSDALKGKFRSCEACSFYKNGYCTQVQPPSKILNVYEAQLCIYYTVEQPAVATKEQIPTPIARPQWYDRNPNPVTKQSYKGGQTPHAVTKRWDYTVPNGKKAFVEYMFIRIIRRTAASAVGIVEAYISVVGAGADSGRIFEASLQTNNVGDKECVIVGQSMILVEGDELVAYDLDSSTDGTLDFIEIAKITEFDA